MKKTKQIRPDNCGIKQKNGICHVKRSKHFIDSKHEFTS